MRVQVDDDASPGVLCVSVRVAVFGGRVGSGGGGGGCTGCFRVELSRNTTRNSRPVLYPYSSGVLELSPGGGRGGERPGSRVTESDARAAPGRRRRAPAAGEARRTRTLGRARAVRDRVIREGVRGVSDLRINVYDLARRCRVPFGFAFAGTG